MARRDNLCVDDKPYKLKLRSGVFARLEGYAKAKGVSRSEAVRLMIKRNDARRSYGLCELYRSASESKEKKETSVRLDTDTDRIVRDQSLIRGTGRDAVIHQIVIEELVDDAGGL